MSLGNIFLIDRQEQLGELQADLLLQLCGLTGVLLTVATGFGEDQGLVQDRDCLVWLVLIGSEVG